MIKCNAYVKLNPGNANKEGELAKALKKLDNKLKDENFKVDIERKRFFVKPGERRRLKSMAARRRARFEARNNKED